MKNNSIKANYKKHEKHYKSLKENPSYLFKYWTKKDTTDYWRHQRMYKNLIPLINKNDSWITIGDGRFGKDANYIISNGSKNVLATDIDDSLLRIGNKKGFINKFKSENAEKLSFIDDEFDYVLCKESFHHFPRPYIALYEMIRIAKKAVVLIEPHDVYIKSSPIAFIKSIFAPSKFTHINKHETSGNFVYGISRRELEKVALGLDLPAIAFKGFDDHYINGVEKEIFKKDAKLAKKIKNKIKLANLLKKLKLRDSSMMIFIIFKTKPTKVTINKLQSDNIEYINLPKNPYL